MCRHPTPNLRFKKRLYLEYLPFLDNPRALASQPIKNPYKILNQKTNLDFITSRYKSFHPGPLSSAGVSLVT